MHLNIVTWNGHQRKAQPVWDFLVQDLRPDIALLQEVRPLAPYTDPAHFVMSREDDAYGTAIYPPIGQVRRLALPREVRSAYAGYVVAAEVQLPDSTPLRLVSLHQPTRFPMWGPSVVVHLRQLFRALQPLVAGYPCIIAGDLNAARGWDTHPAQPKCYSHSEFFDEVEGWLTNATLVCYRRKEVHTLYRTNLKDRVYQNDYIFLSRELESWLRRCDLICRDCLGGRSDHSPVRCVLAPAQMRTRAEETPAWPCSCQPGVRPSPSGTACDA